MGADAIAANLLRLRSAAELTQDQLAESAGLSRVAYRNIEHGESIPRAATLSSLARALGVPLGELVAPTVTLRRVRFRSLKRMKRRGDVLARVGRWLQDFSALEELLGERQPAPLSELRRVAEDAVGPHPEPGDPTVPHARSARLGAVGTRGELRKRVGVRNETLGAAVERMIAAGKILRLEDRLAVPVPVPVPAPAISRDQRERNEP